MTHAHIADAVKEIVIGFISMTRLPKNHNIKMKPNIVIFKGLLVSIFILV